MSIEKINFSKEGLDSLLSPLESDIVSYLWESKKPVSSTDVFLKVGKKNRVAATTISVTLDRLFEKELVDRTVERGKGGLKYLYRAKISREDLADQLSQRFVQFLKGTFGASSVAHLKKRL